MEPLTIIEPLVKIALALGFLMTAAAYLVLLERWVAAWVQDRLGPNRVGIPLTRFRMFGLGQPLADGVKFVCKEEVTPRHVDRALYFLGPLTMFVSALAVFAVIPFGSVLPEDLGIRGVSHQIHLIIAPGIDVGLVYVVAVGSTAVYGVLLGSWASNNKYGFFGGLRSSAQLISYEIPMGLALLGVVLCSGSLRLESIIGRQAESGVWNIFVEPLGFLVFLVASYAEATRMPFDLPEAEQELVGGYHTEYSGIKLMMLLVGEYMHMLTASMLLVILYFGGWHLWGLTGSDDHMSWLQALLRIAVLAGKVMLVILFFMISRWSWPRFRFDQLMNLAWKVMVPLGMVNLLFVACWIEYAPRIFELGRFPQGLPMAVAGWTVLMATWLAVTLIVPAASDNRPRLESIRTPEDLDEEVPVG
jgi:NADH-quinone oxidoreductase subunit H